MLSQHVKTLPNGLRVVTVAQPHLHAVAVALVVRCGSRHEGPAQWGLSHLVEHMLFRGSARHPTATALALAFEAHGGTLEAGTWRDHTHFSVTLHPAGLGPVLAALGDMVTRPRLADLAIERGVVAAEIGAEVDAQGRELAVDNLARAAVWRRHPMGRRIVGSRASVARLDAAAVAAHHARYYTARNAVLCVAGPVAAATVNALAARAFAAMRPGAPARDGTPAQFAPTARLRTALRPQPQVSLALTCAAMPERTPDFAAATLLASILDDGMASRLPEALCGRQGLAYHLESGLDCYADCGLYEIAADVAPGDVVEAVALILRELHATCAAPPSAAELERARRRHLHALAFRDDVPEETAQQVATEVLFSNSRRERGHSGPGRCGPARAGKGRKISARSEESRSGQGSHRAARSDADSGGTGRSGVGCGDTRHSGDAGCGGTGRSGDAGYGGTGRSGDARYGNTGRGDPHPDRRGSHGGRELDESTALIAVSQADVQRVARQLFRPGGLHLTLMGPLAGVDLRALRCLLRAFRARAPGQRRASARIALTEP